MAGKPSRWVRRVSVWVFAYLGLLILIWGAYHGTLHQFFVPDDFADLRFLGRIRGPLIRYLDPTFASSDPVTGSRYLPVKVLSLLALERTFGLHATPYHATSLLIHGLNALLVGHVTHKALGDRWMGGIAAVLFATSRLNAQNVCWMVCIPNLLGTALLLAVAALYLRRPRNLLWAPFSALLLLMSFFSRSDSVVAVAFFVPWWLWDYRTSRRQGSLYFAACATVAAAIAGVLFSINGRAFPEPGFHLGFEPRRFLLFVVNVFSPYDLPIPFKVALTLVVVIATFLSRDRHLIYALYGIALGAASWAALVYLNLTPRYFYAYGALSSAVLGCLIVRAGRRILRARGNHTAAIVACAIAAWNIASIARRDVVWFDYLSIPGRKLMALMEQRKASHATEPLRVATTPYPLVVGPDAAFFEPYLMVVQDGTEEVSVDTEAERFMRYYRADFGTAFWYYPWFLQ